MTSPGVIFDFGEVIKIDKLDNVITRLLKEYYAIQEKDIKEEFIYSVDVFYSDYDPLYYHRLGNITAHSSGLYDALYIENSSKKFEWYMDDTLLPQHQQNNSIVADLNMKKGQHGGIQYIKGGIVPVTNPSIEYRMYKFWEIYSGLKYGIVLDLVKKYKQQIINAIRR